MSVKNIIQKNTVFFVAYTMLLLIAIYFLTVTSHGDEILFFSNRHTPFFDTFFAFITKLSEPNIYGFIIPFLLFFRFGYAKMMLLLGITVALCQWLLKITFLQLRPYNFFDDQGLIHQLNFVPGVPIYKHLTSFPSGHTISAFAIYCFLALIFSKNKILQISLLAVALLIGISRIYLLQHFINDVAAGSLVGIFLAMFFYHCHLLSKNNHSFWAKKINLNI
jgi:membrane-associated phospholipid phosphatase